MLWCHRICILGLSGGVATECNPISLYKHTNYLSITKMHSTNKDLKSQTRSIILLFCLRMYFEFTFLRSHAKVKLSFNLFLHLHAAASVAYKLELYRFDQICNNFWYPNFALTISVKT